MMFLVFLFLGAGQIVLSFFDFILFLEAKKGFLGRHSLMARPQDSVSVFLEKKVITPIF